MCSLELLLEVLSLGLLFVLFVTGAYKKSITTSIYVISLAIAYQCYAIECTHLAFIVVSLGALISLARAMFQHSKDRLVRL